MRAESWDDDCDGPPCDEDWLARTVKRVRMGFHTLKDRPVKRDKRKKKKPRRHK